MTSDFDMNGQVTQSISMADRIRLNGHEMHNKMVCMSSDLKCNSRSNVYPWRQSLQKSDTDFFNPIIEIFLLKCVLYCLLLHFTRMTAIYITKCKTTLYHDQSTANTSFSKVRSSKSELCNFEGKCYEFELSGWHEHWGLVDANLIYCIS